MKPELRNAQYAMNARSKTGAIVIGGNTRGLGIVRSLGRRGIPVWVLTSEHSMAAASRYNRRTLAWPSGTEEQQLSYLLDLATKYHLQGWALFPIVPVAVR